MAARFDLTVEFVLKSFIVRVYTCIYIHVCVLKLLHYLCP